MYAYILLVAVIGSATAAPLTTKPNTEANVETVEPVKPIETDPLLLKEAAIAADAPLLSEAPISTSAADPAAPALAAAGVAAPAAVADAAPLALKAGVPSPKSLSLISEIRSPLITPLLAPLGTQIISTRQIPPYIYTSPGLATLELAAAPPSYSIEQHGYRITY